MTPTSKFQNSADMHPHDTNQARSRLSVMIADFGLPDVLALLADEVRSQCDYGLRDVRRVLDTRADAIASLSEVIR